MSAENVTREQDSLFTPSVNSKITAGGVVRFIIAMILVLGGFYLMALAFSVPHHLGFITFFGGVLVDALGFILAYGFNPSSELKQTAR